MRARDLLYYRPAGELREIFREVTSAGWNVHIARNSKDAVEIIEGKGVRVGLTPLRRGSDLEHELDTLSRLNGGIAWLGLVDEKTIEADPCQRIIAKYCFDYHTLPIDSDRLLFSLGHAHGMAHLQSSASALPSERVGSQRLVGSSAAMRHTVESMHKVARVDAPLLIAGENGTGKEMTARAVHELSDRGRGPFLAVSCASLPPDAEAHLFGAEPGGSGLVQRASGGTLFLDDIDELQPHVQVRLVGLLQTSTLGDGEQCIPVDTRILAATKVDLEAMVAEGRFRRDLYDRLNVLSIHLPPLRERGRDLEHLAHHFFQIFADEEATRAKGFNGEALRAMAAHPWPGNIRELVNRVRRAIVMSDGKLITPCDLGLETEAAQSSPTTLKEARAEAESRVILRSLDQSGKNITRAARELGVSRVTLYRLMEKHNINPSSSEPMN